MQTLTVKNITKKYNDVPAVDDVSFSIHRGQVVGLLGPNGAGKTTTMSIITGIMSADEGQVLFDEQELSPETEHGIKKKIGFLSEANPLYPELFVSEYLDFMAGMRGMPKEERKTAIARVAEETGIEDKLHQPIEELSKGYRQRVGLAQAILHQPELLILDEPTEGLDPNQRVSIRDLINRLGKERTVLISTHVMAEVQAMCDSVLILDQGKLIAEGTVDQVINQAKGGQSIEFAVKGENIRKKLEEEGFSIVRSSRDGELQRFTLSWPEDSDARPKLFKLAQAEGWTLFELYQVSMSLEDTFRQLTAKQNVSES